MQNSGCNLTFLIQGTLIRGLQKCTSLFLSSLLTSSTLSPTLKDITERPQESLSLRRSLSKLEGHSEKKSMSVLTILFKFQFKSFLFHFFNAIFALLCEEKSRAQSLHLTGTQTSPEMTCNLTGGK